MGQLKNVDIIYYAKGLQVYNLTKGETGLEKDKKRHRKSGVYMLLRERSRTTYGKVGDEEKNNRLKRKESGSLQESREGRKRRRRTQANPV
jgi:hypothetical protein